MNRHLPWWIGAVVVIAVTTTMDATGLAMFSALPLLPLTLLFWWFTRLARGEMGWRWGRPRDYGVAVLYPLAVLGVAAAVVFTMGVTDTTEADWSKAGMNLLLVSLSTIIGGTLTEEFFFRGWLWAALRRAGWTERRVLIGSSVVFSLWHVSAVVLPTGFDLPAAQVPVYLVNATLIGLVWGLMRLRSGSILVTGVSHGVWNGLAYVLFGFGRETGALGVTETIIYGPEVGLLGTVLSGSFAWWLWRRT